jgi:hypothetical protein
MKSNKYAKRRMAYSGNELLMIYEYDIIPPDAAALALFKAQAKKEGMSERGIELAIYTMEAGHSQTEWDAIMQKAREDLSPRTRG